MQTVFTEIQAIKPAVPDMKPGCEGHVRLSGNMSLPQLVMTVLAFNAPLTSVASTVPLVIGVGSGLAAPILFMVLGLLMAIFAVGYTVMARVLPRSGAFYTFVAAGLGRPMGLAVSLIAMLTYLGFFATVLPFTSLALEHLVMTFDGPDIAWWAWAFLLLAGIGFLGFMRVDFSARIIGILVLFELALVMAFAVAVIAKGGATGHFGYQSLNPAQLAHGGVIMGMVFAVMSFSGFEATAIYRDEVRDPGRNIPRAAYISVTVVALFCAFGSWLLIQAYGEGAAVAAIAADPATAFLSSLHRYAGAGAYNFGTILLVTSSFAALTSTHNVLARYIFNLGADGILPRALGRSHPRLGSPYRASLLLTATTISYVAVAAASGVPAVKLFTSTAGAGGYAFVFMMFIASLGIAAFLIRTRPGDATRWHTIVAPILAAAAMTAVIIILTQRIDLLTGAPILSTITLLLVAACMILGISIALILRSKRPRLYAQIGTGEY